MPGKASKTGVGSGLPPASGPRLTAIAMTKGLPICDSAVAAMGRGFLYRLFSLAYIKEPSQEIIDFFSSPEASEIIASLGTGPKTPVLTGDKGEGRLSAMKEEYAALFILPGGVSPFESVRTKGLLCQEPEQRAAAFYARCGLEVPEDSTVFADHVGMELDFMAHLASQESKAAQALDPDGVLRWQAVEKDFFREHLGKWVFGFLDDAIMYSRDPFYKGVSALAKDFLMIEREDLLNE